ncbi:HlyD family secretion protein [Bacteroides sp. 519]|uniref:HlyD family secretion protein n=1 Tax=Bacteroides sp. 519 TaxID=2302937 RepID=UPI0013D5F3B6|nr:HlyD family efflux transporter periplasmic adaptor subunit [Bacteroides sp. 519]NDV59454.1 HlyD family efflux transporter periplasmic adaptor subunit [Bacteroides sp. 519]
MKTFKYLVVATFVLSVSGCNNKGLKYDASGIFEVTEVVISAQGNGEIKEFRINEGDVLEANQQVGCIDTIQLYLKKNQLEANIASIRNKKSTPSVQIAAIEQQIKTQKNEQKRYRDLVVLNAANQKQLDDINAQISLLERQLAAQYETINNANNSLTDQGASLNAQIAQLDDQINKSIITSPIKGTVLAKYAEQGELAAQGKALFKIADVETMYLRVYVTASQLTAIKNGQEVKVYSDMGDSDYTEHSGKITWISDKAEFTPKTIQTRDERANLVYAVKIQVKNNGYIKKGMYGEVKF